MGSQADESQWGTGEAAWSVPVNALEKNIMSRALTKIAYCVCIASLAATLVGCAESSYPSLPGLPSANERLLTPTEQQKVIRDIGGESAATGQPQ
jgi:hypothetical protein